MGGYFDGVAGTWRRQGLAAVDRDSGGLRPFDPRLAGDDVTDLALVLLAPALAVAVTALTGSERGDGDCTDAPG
jgi:hypothetical protein